MWNFVSLTNGCCVRIKSKTMTLAFAASRSGSTYLSLILCQWAKIKIQPSALVEHNNLPSKCSLFSPWSCRTIDRIGVRQYTLTRSLSVILYNYPPCWSVTQRFVSQRKVRSPEGSHSNKGDNWHSISNICSPYTK